MDSIRALVIEDDQVDIMHLTRLLGAPRQNPTYRLDVTQSLTEAIDALGSESFDVILMDLDLPDSVELSGVERIAADYPLIPIVVMTGLSDDRVALTAIKSGAQDYIVKGEYDVKTLRRSLSHAIERKQLENSLKQARQTIVEQQEQLLEEERRRLVIEMAASTAHELNSPITGMVGYLEMLRNGESPLDGEALKLLANMEKCLEDMRIRVRKVEKLNHYRTKEYVGGKRIMDLSTVNSRRVLLIDADVHQATRIRNLIERDSACTVDWVRDGRSALALLQHHRYDAAIASEVLPDGWAVNWFGRVAADDQRPFAIIVREYPNDSVGRDSLEHGVAAYLSKDTLSETTLHTALERVFERTRLEREMDRVGIVVPANGHSRAESPKNGSR
ncbi:MAG: response regulator [Deltaproteobacteria bacterium]|nr:response regulator [bacterium]MCB9476953.1 response regulator [Deltaproteobacteria bacterium]MCB9478667.1 response regulator [Deltaproteobacteria bacterium]MCB9489803.1 response regulator [Deltaproteobacteria bacterium]